MSNEFRRNEMGLPHPYRVGIIGGTSYVSTELYYHRINKLVNEAMGGLTSSPILLESLEFGVIDALMKAGDWKKVEKILQESAEFLVAGKVDLVAIASNTLHRVVPRLDFSYLPFIHIGTAIAEKVKAAKVSRVGFFGTKETMQGDFIIGRIQEAGVEVFTPDEHQQDAINAAIFDEYCVGNFNTTNRLLLYGIACQMCKKYEIEGLVLGCTELGEAFSEGYRTNLIRACVDGEPTCDPTLTGPSDTGMPKLQQFHFFDSAEIHIQAIANACIYGPVA